MKMELYTTDNGKMVYNTDQEEKLGKTVLINENLIKLTFIYIVFSLQDLNMKEISQKVKNPDKDYSNGKMETLIKENSLIIK